MGSNNPSAKGLKKIAASAAQDKLTSIAKDPKAGKHPEPKSKLHHKSKKKSK